MTVPVVPDWTKAPAEWFRWAQAVERRLRVVEAAGAGSDEASVSLTQDDPIIYQSDSPDTTRKTLIPAAPYALSVSSITTVCRQGSADVLVYVGDTLVASPRVSPVLTTSADAFEVDAGQRVDIQFANFGGGVEAATVQFNATRSLTGA